MLIDVPTIVKLATNEVPVMFRMLESKPLPGTYMMAAADAAETPFTSVSVGASTMIGRKASGMGADQALLPTRILKSKGEVEEGNWEVMSNDRAVGLVSWMGTVETVMPPV
jgi:hypothetical protein